MKLLNCSKIVYSLFRLFLSYVNITSTVVLCFLRHAARGVRVHQREHRVTGQLEPYEGGAALHIIKLLPSVEVVQLYPGNVSHLLRKIKSAHLVQNSDRQREGPV